MHEIPNDLRYKLDAPVEYVDDVGGVYFRAILLETAGDIVPQHVHDHDHVTLIASGKARVWVDRRWLGDFEAFRAIEIMAGKEHVFMALEPMTRLACVHVLQGAPYMFARETKLEV